MMKERAAGKSQEQATVKANITIFALFNATSGHCLTTVQLLPVVNIQKCKDSTNIKSRKTVAKYERVGRLPNALKVPRQWRTRADPFAEDWAQVESMLAANPGLEAKTLFGWLCEQAPTRYQASQVRTQQRGASDSLFPGAMRYNGRSHSQVAASAKPFVMK